MVARCQAFSGERQPRRHAYSAEFKLQVVREALKRPPSNRIKPICRLHPGIEPVQLRKWIRNLAALESAEPSAKCIPSARRPPNYEVGARHPRSIIQDTYASMLWQSALAISSPITASSGYGYYGSMQPGYPQQHTMQMGMPARTPLEQVTDRASQPHFAHRAARGPAALLPEQGANPGCDEEHEFAAHELLLLSCSYRECNAQPSQPRVLAAS